MDYCKYRGGRQETSAVSWTRLFYFPAYSPAPDWYYSLALHSLDLDCDGITSPRFYPARGRTVFSIMITDPVVFILN